MSLDIQTAERYTALYDLAGLLSDGKIAILKYNQYATERTQS